jgi:hemoglobin
LIWIKPERPERQYLYFEYRFGAGAMPEECNAITEETLRALVTAFYARVRQDPELGPIFNDAISDWPHHLRKLTDFWHSVMLTSGRYKGNPMIKHMLHRARMNPADFTRWLALWRQTTNELMAPSAAAALQAKAERIGDSLQLALFYRPEVRAERGPGNTQGASHD